MAERITLLHTRAPGDIVAMTALVRDLALTYPNQYVVRVNTPNARDVWKYNPHIEQGEPLGPTLKLDYGPYIRVSGTKPIHFLTGFHGSFQKLTGRKVPLHRPHPDLHLGEDMPRQVDGRYWVTLSGGKTDFTNKHWVTSRHQEVVDTMTGLGFRVVQVGGKGSNPGHVHPPLKRVIDLLGKTSLRQLFHLIRHADGVICPITMPMHVAAALGRPCVVIAGGREEWWWEGYHRDNPGLGPAAGLLPVNHRYLHTQGLLPCCASKGCWTSKVVRAKPDERNVCHDAVKAENGQFVPRCLDMISVDRVLANVLSYYADGTLTPIEGVPVTNISGDTEVVTPDGDRITLTVRRLQAARPAPPTPPTPVEAPVVVQTAPVVSGVSPISTPPLARPFFTLFVLTYGEFPDMHRRCLSAIGRTTTPAEVDLRVYANQLGPASEQVVMREVEGRATKVYRSTENRHKYMVMREMFRDQAHPITSPWVIWFDDDSMCDINPNWLKGLKSLIQTSVARDPAVGMVGAKFFWSLDGTQANWLRAASWFRNRPLRDRLGHPSPNGNKVHFVTGGCWALRTDVIAAADIPDARLQHNGGDVAIGEQIYQAGFSMVNWNSDKRQVITSAAPRRGTNQGKIHWVF